MHKLKRNLVALPSERILGKIFLIRDKKVMFDRDLAELYEVETKVLNQAVKRNLDRFPSDFMFQLTKQEAEIYRSQIVIYKENLRSQIVTSSWGGRRSLPMVFTEQGIAMLSSVLKSDKAVQVNIQIIRTFIQLRELLATNTQLRKKIEEMEAKYDKKLKHVFDLLKQLLIQEEAPKRPIGFRTKMLVEKSR